MFLCPGLVESWIWFPSPTLPDSDWAWWNYKKWNSRKVFIHICDNFQILGISAHTPQTMRWWNIWRWLYNVNVNLKRFSGILLVSISSDSSSLSWLWPMNWQLTGCWRGPRTCSSSYVQRFKKEFWNQLFTIIIREGWFSQRSMA